MLIDLQRSSYQLTLNTQALAWGSPSRASGRAPGSKLHINNVEEHINVGGFKIYSITSIGTVYVEAAGHCLDEFKRGSARRSSIRLVRTCPPPVIPTLLTT